ncbi:MAG: NUDIX domain-containing protein [Rothia sp. (in: high G+C Gram-positive bacteria)]|uniref:NUDIX hydrolase n=1 Tax=Rothia sp. (in: high G+C Gram-positive bacteria) TaxID=1885016 RepID=UPI0026DF7696|nr:NUDIX domain-containing protein [Rothia sp. (in: high G+C Gram-positive bacteria)]MDO5750071.1 NUDIX domain-containing protein [Rothia sp. (in: high G+C Gram-positive bacteria)]
MSSTPNTTDYTPDYTHQAIDTTRREIRVSAVAIRDSAGLVLTVRKNGTDGFMMPGGKPDPGEDALDAAVREVTEELGFAPDPARLHFLGTFSAPALNENGFTVIADSFEYRPTQAEEAHLKQNAPRAEIAEMRWVDPATDTREQAPLNIDCIFPALLAQR